MSDREEFYRENLNTWGEIVTEDEAICPHCFNESEAGEVIDYNENTFKAVTCFGCKKEYKVASYVIKTYRTKI